MFLTTSCIASLKIISVISVYYSISPSRSRSPASRALIMVLGCPRISPLLSSRRDYSLTNHCCQISATTQLPIHGLRASLDRDLASPPDLITRHVLASWDAFFNFNLRAVCICKHKCMPLHAHNSCLILRIVHFLIYVESIMSFRI
jgi:hypothetical protein